MSESAAELLPEAPPALRRVPAPLLHLTLAFIGNVPAERREGIAAALEEPARRSAAIDLELSGLGAFPASGPPQIAWVRARTGGPGDPLGALAADVRDALAKADVPFDPKPFRPHVTLARARKDVTAADAGRIRRLLAQEVPRLTFRADAISLVESRLSPMGPSYTTLASLPLGATPGTRTS